MKNGERKKSEILRFHIDTDSYLSFSEPSTCVKLPSPEATPIRSNPLNHFTECNSPQFFVSIGHFKCVVVPRLIYNVVVSIRFVMKIIEI